MITAAHGKVQSYCLVDMENKNRESWCTVTQNENPDTSNKRSTYIRSNKKWGVPQEETRQYIMEEYHKSVEEIEEYITTYWK